MSCDNYLGAKSVVSFDDLLAATDDPTVGTGFKAFGLTNANSLSSSANTIDVTNDTTGSVAATMAVGETFDITVSGFAATSDVADKVNQYYLKNFYHTRLAAGEQPKVWVEVVTPAETIYVYCLITGYTTSGGSKEAQTLEFSLSATSTCDPDKPSVIYSVNA